MRSATGELGIERSERGESNESALRELLSGSKLMLLYSDEQPRSAGLMHCFSCIEQDRTCHMQKE